MSLPLVVTPLTLPENICNSITSIQAQLDIFAQYLSVTYPGDITGISVGATPPTDTTKAWLKLDTLGRPDKLYYYMGSWLAMNPLVPGFTMIWTDALPDLNTFDGGDSTLPVGYANGPMWEVVSSLAQRLPLGVGTLPDTSTVVGVGDTGGSETHAITIPELPAHHHTVTSKPGLDINNAATVPRTLFGTSDPQEFNSTNDTGDTGSGTAMSLMPPYVGVYFLRRTARLYYVGV